MVVEAIGAVSATLSSISTAFNLAKNLHSGVVDAAAKEKITDIQTALSDALSRAVEAQSGQSAMVEEINRLKAQIAEFEAWDREKEKYELHQPAPGVFTYAAKDQPTSSEAKVQICPNCYENRQKSMLQFLKADHGRIDLLSCPRCDTELITRGHRHPETSPQRRRR